MDRAKEHLVNMPPRVALPGMRRALTEHERLVMAYVVGSYEVSGDPVQVEYDSPDSDVVE